MSQQLFNYLSQEFGITPTESQMQEIQIIVLANNKRTNNTGHRISELSYRNAVATVTAYEHQQYNEFKRRIDSSTVTLTHETIMHELELSTRLWNIAKSNDFADMTLKEVSEIPYRELRRFRNVGEKTIQEINHILSCAGLGIIKLD